MAADLSTTVPRAIAETQQVTAVELRGSRARGDAGPLSDWDFVVRTRDLDVTMQDLPRVAATLGPLVQQWDRLSDVPCYMLILSGPTKVDLIFEGHRRPLDPPWTVARETLPALDDHFWDWTLWLASKVDAGKHTFVTEELRKMHDHLLAPLGATAPPASLGEAVAGYLRLRSDWEQRLGLDLASEVQRQVLRAVAGVTRT